MMKKEWVLCLILLLTACEEQPFEYVIPANGSVQIVGNIWKKGDSTTLYADLYTTENYFVFANYSSAATLQVFDKTNSSAAIAYETKQEEGNLFYSIEFVESNSRYSSEANDIWIVENKNKLKQIRYRDGSLSTINTIPLHWNLSRSTSYNLTKEEIYGVPTKVSASNTFYFFNPDSGYYWVNMHGADKLRYKKNPYAYLSNLCINEEQNAVVCAFRFFNQVQFFDLRGNVIRKVSVGEKSINPQNDWEGSLDYENSIKCFIDICGTSKYVYCLYDGSLNYDKQSKIMVFRWDGTYVKTFTTNYILKNIAVNDSDTELIALATNEQGGRDVVSFLLKKGKS